MESSKPERQKSYYEGMEELLRTVQSGRMKDYMDEVRRVPDID